jgi:hypothetical protein
LCSVMYFLMEQRKKLWLVLNYFTSFTK